MKKSNGYIMQDQARGVVTALMADGKRRYLLNPETKAHLVSVAVVFSVYAFSVVASV